MDPAGTNIPKNHILLSEHYNRLMDSIYLHDIKFDVVSYENSSLVNGSSNILSEYSGHGGMPGGSSTDGRSESVSGGILSTQVADSSMTVSSEPESIESTSLSASTEVHSTRSAEDDPTESTMGPSVGYVHHLRLINRWILVVSQEKLVPSFAPITVFTGPGSYIEVSNYTDLIANAIDTYNRLVLIQRGVPGDQLENMVSELSGADPIPSDLFDNITINRYHVFKKYTPEEKIRAGEFHPIAIVTPEYKHDIFLHDTFPPNASERINGVFAKTVAHELVHIAQHLGYIEYTPVVITRDDQRDRDYSDKLSQGIVFSELTNEEQAEFVEDFSTNRINWQPDLDQLFSEIPE